MFYASYLPGRYCRSLSNKTRPQSSRGRAVTWTQLELERPVEEHIRAKMPFPFQLQRERFYFCFSLTF